MKPHRLSIVLILAAGFGAACSSLPERPGSEKMGTGGYANSRNEACLFEANQALEFGKYDEVERVLSRWQGPMEDARPLVLAARAAVALGNFGYAAELCQRAASFSPTDSEIHSLEARCQEALGQWKAAAQGYARAVQFDLFDVESATGCLRSLVAAGDTDSAFRCAQEGWGHFGTDAEYASYAADIAFTMGAFELASHWTRAARSLGSTHEGLEERLILALAWTGETQAALEEAGRSESGTWAPEVFRAVGQCALAEGQIALASRHFQSYLGLRPESAGGWHDLARAQFLAGTPEKALASAEQSIRRDPASADCLLLKAHCLMQLDRLEQAAVAYCDAEARGADPALVQPYLDQLVMREGNSLQALPASSAKEAEVSPRR
jgi:tetratricopeptide (TPR) repeat protein